MRILLEIDVVIDPQYRDVVVKGSRVEFRMHLNARHVSFDVRIEFDVVIHVPFAESDPEIMRSVSLHAVSGGENVTRGNESSSADVDALRWILLQNGNLPWVFACVESFRLVRVEIQEARLKIRVESA